MAVETRAEKARRLQAGPGTSKATTQAAGQPVPEAGEKKVDTRRVRVRATEMGYYQHKRRREGDIFTLVAIKTVKRDERGQVIKDKKTRLPIPVVKTAMEQFSDRWMEIVDTAERESITGPQQALKIKHDDEIRARMGTDEDPDSGDDNDASSDLGDDNVLNEDPDGDDSL